MKLLFLFFCACVAGLQLGLSQTTVSGTIMDNHGAPLPFSSINLIYLDDSTTVKHVLSDENGNFRASLDTRGQYRLSVKYLGYVSLEKVIEMNDKDVILEGLILTENTTALHEVEVRAKRNLVEQQADRTVVNVHQLALAAGGSALELISQMPGIGVDRQNNVVSMNGKTGLIIAINGKPTRMDETSLLQWLETMPASNIEKIELIHTPPASFDAAGNAGVLNIVLKRKEDLGQGGNFSVYGGYGVHEKYGGAANWYRNQERLRAFADVAVNGNKTVENTTIYLATLGNGGFDQSRLESFRPAFKGIQTARLGLDYDLTSKTTVSAVLAGHLSLWELDAKTNTITETAQSVYNQSVLTAKETNNWRHLMGNIGVQHQLTPAHSISLDYDYLYYFANNPTDYVNQNFNKLGTFLNKNTFVSRKNTPINLQVMKLDYIRNLTKNGRIEAGLKGTLYDFRNDVAVSNLVQEDWVVDQRFSSNLNLKENIGAAYISANWQPTVKWVLNGGLRFEQTLTQLIDQERDLALRRNYGRFFPTLSVSYQVNESNQWQLAYNERITRPPLFWMAPALFFFGPGIVLGGNPSVLPAQSRQITSSWKHKSLLFTLQVSHERQALTFQPLIDPSTQLSIFRVENMKSMKTVMFSINHNVQQKWWTSQANIAFYGQQNTPVYNGEVVEFTDAYFRLNTTQSIRLPRGFSFELTNQTTTKQQYGLGVIPFNTLFSAGIQKQIGGNNKLTFHVFDIFDSGSFYSSKVNTQNLVNNFDYQYEGSVFKLTYLREFGKSLKKKSGTRQSASADDRMRVQ